MRLLAVDSDDLDEQVRKELHAAIEAGDRELDRGHGVTEEEALNRVGDASDPSRDWPDYMRYRFEACRKAFARGDVVSTEPDALMDSIERELCLA